MNAITSTTTAESACCSSCAEPSHTGTLAIACTLEEAEYDNRIAAIRELAARALLKSERDGLSLHLTYADHALGQIEAIVAMESECCAFLDFNLEQGTGVVYLTINAPASFTNAANELFTKFAPGQAGETI